MTLIEASELCGLPYSAMNARWKRGIRGSDLFSPLKERGEKRLVFYHGREVSLKELSILTGTNINTLKSRYRAGKRGKDLINKIC